MILQDLVILQACVDHVGHNYVLYRSVYYGKRA